MLEPASFFGDGLIEPVLPGPAPRLSDYLQGCERSYIGRALEQRGGHIGATALDLGISRKNLWEKMKKLGLPPKGESTQSCGGGSRPALSRELRRIPVHEQRLLPPPCRVSASHR